MRELFERNGICTGGDAAIDTDDNPSMKFSGEGWTLTAEWPSSLKELVLQKIRDFTGKRVRVEVYVEDE